MGISMICSNFGTPTMMAWPPRRVIASACSIGGPRPMTSNATSAPRPPVSSMHLGDRVAVAAR